MDATFLRAMTAVAEVAKYLKNDKEKHFEEVACRSIVGLINLKSALLSLPTDDLGDNWMEKVTVALRCLKECKKISDELIVAKTEKDDDGLAKLSDACKTCDVATRAA